MVDAEVDVDPGPENFMSWLEFASTPELDELDALLHRLGRRYLADAARDSEHAGRWPERAMEVLNNLPLAGLDVTRDRQGTQMGVSAKATGLMALAYYDAGGLPGADRLGPAAGAVTICPDQGLANEVMGQCIEGTSACGFTIVDPEVDFRRLDWVPDWGGSVPGGRLKWIWVSQANTLSLYQLTGPTKPVRALAFQASGAVSVDAEATSLVGQWDLDEWSALYVRGRARLWAAAIGVGIAKSAIDATIEYAAERVVFGKPVAHHQANAFDLAGAAAGVHGAGLVVANAAAGFDRRHHDAGFWATQAWLETADSAFVATNLGIQLLGGHGFLVDHLAEKRFREARHLSMLFGGRDWAELDVASHVLDVEDPLGVNGTYGGSNK